ncbi:Sphingomyelin phosphodiesterase, partial [Blyttiomyces sp. JEL0837]
QTLKSLQSSNRIAYVIGHVPPKSVKEKKAYLDVCYDSYLSIVATYAQSGTLAAHFHGHTNVDSVSFLTINKKSNLHLNVVTQNLADDSDSPLDSSLSIVHVFTNGPSIIPLANPAVRVYSYDTGVATLGNLLDYQQFYTDLEGDNGRGSVKWELEYKASTAYAMTDLSLKTWVKTLKGFWKSGSQTYPLYQNYFNVGV